jgi:uncharacterized membrane protein
MRPVRRTVAGFAVTLLGLVLFTAMLAAPVLVLAAGLGALTARVAATVQRALVRRAVPQGETVESTAESATY